MDLIRVDDFENFNDIDDIDEIDEEVIHVVQRRVRRRYIRDAENPFEFYDDGEFQRRYRFSKESVMHGIFPKIEEGLARINNRGLPVAPILQLLISLRYYATASFQLLLGDVNSVSQPTISRIVFNVSLLIASLIMDYIKFPVNRAAQMENHRLFHDRGRGNGGIGLPCVDGAIDCTHIRLTATRFQIIDEIYRNRKGYFSPNVQAIVGPRTEFLDLVPEWPGSNHDGRIFQNSLIRIRYMRGELQGMLVGDSGYPCLTFLMTPLRNPYTDEEFTYNAIQIRTRNIVERTFGIWKRRFPCLARGLTTKLLTSTAIVVSCAVLHNMSLIFRDVLPEEDGPEVEEEDRNPNVPGVENIDSLAAREALIARLFP